MSDYLANTKFAAAQNNQILKLQKLVEQLQAENKHLQDLLKAAIPMRKEEIVEALTNEEIIAENEILKLKKLSEQQVLTTDEAKRLLNYVQILQGRRKKDKGSDETKALTTEELLEQLKV